MQVDSCIYSEKKQQHGEGVNGIALKYLLGLTLCTPCYANNSRIYFISPVYVTYIVKALARYYRVLADDCAHQRLQEVIFFSRFMLRRVL